MNAGQTIFSQLMDFMPTYESNRCVHRYRGNYRVRQFFCRDQFLCMAFAQLTYRQSLRDIETCLGSMSHKLYHAGFRATMARNTPAKANENRDWRIYADFAAVLIVHARRLYLKADENTTYGKTWTRMDLAMGMAIDFGDFIRLAQAVDGKRVIANAQEKMKHELADLLWSVFVLSQKYEIDLEKAFLAAMDNLDRTLSDKEGSEQPRSADEAADA